MWYQNSCELTREFTWNLILKNVLNFKLKRVNEKFMWIHQNSPIKQVNPLHCTNFTDSLTQLSKKSEMHLENKVKNKVISVKREAHLLNVIPNLGQLIIESYTQLLSTALHHQHKQLWPFANKYKYGFNRAIHDYFWKLKIFCYYQQNLT